jgi:hypothetical protein
LKEGNVIQLEAAQDVMYRYHHTNDIHEIVVRGSERGAMNGMFEVMRWVYERPSSHRLTRVLLVKEGSMIPVSSFVTNIRDMIMRHPMINNRTPTRFAVITERSAVIRMAQNILKPMRVMSAVHFYGHSQYREACDWLKS